MASRDDLNSLRSQARKRHQAVTRKISRFTRQGIKISGTEKDPRRDLEKLKGYNSVQLRAYIAKLDSFASRETQFAPGKGGKALPGADMLYYNKLQRQLNRDKQKAFNQIKDVFIPSQGMTIGERVAAVTPDHPVMAPPSSYAPHIQFTRTSTGIPSPKALRKLIKQMEADQNGGFLNRKHKSQFTAAKKMVKGIRNPNLAKEFNTLSPEEFNVLWNYTNFAEVAAMDYVIRKSMYHDKTELAWYDVALDAQLREARARIAEIKSLNLGGKNNNATRKKGKLGS